MCLSGDTGTPFASCRQIVGKSSLRSFSNKPIDGAARPPRSRRTGSLVANHVVRADTTNRRPHERSPGTRLARPTAFIRLRSPSPHKSPTALLCDTPLRRTSRVQASAISANTLGQWPISGCRNSRIVGYRGESARSRSQRHSASFFRATQTGCPKAPARCAIEVSQVTTRSRWAIAAAASTNVSVHGDAHDVDGHDDAAANRPLAPREASLLRDDRRLESAHRKSRPIGGLRRLARRVKDG